MNVVALPFPDMVAALTNGSIDAGLLIEPFVAAAVGSGVGVRWKGVDEFSPSYQIAMLLYAPHFAAPEQRSVAERFMLGYLRGVRDYNDAFVSHRGQDSVFDILIHHTPVKNRALDDVMVPGRALARWPDETISRGDAQNGHRSRPTDRASPPRDHCGPHLRGPSRTPVGPLPEHYSGVRGY